MNTNIPIVRNEKSLLHNNLVSALADTIRSHAEEPILFLYSGGSSLQLMIPLCDALREINLTNLLFAPVDERNSEEWSNAFALERMEVSTELARKGATFIQLNDYSGKVEVAGENYNEQLRVLFEDISVHDGVIISLLGMGSDGHTAGIFPYPEEPDFFQKMFIDTDNYVIGYDVGEKNPYKERVTLTVPALQRVGYTYVYVVGEDKRDALSKALTVGPVAEVPARLWGSLQNCTIYTDILL